MRGIMTIDNEIHLKKIWIVVKSRGGKSVAETAIWVDSTVEKVLLDRGEIRDVDSVKFHINEEEASKRWRYE